MSGYRPDKEVLTAMLAKAEEKLAIAQNNLDAGFFDDASSRAYYAAFHAVSAVLAQHGMTYSSHHQVLGAFNRDFVNTGLFSPNAHKNLERLFLDRQIGDYYIDQTIDRKKAE